MVQAIGKPYWGGLCERGIGIGAERRNGIIVQEPGLANITPSMPVVVTFSYNNDIGAIGYAGDVARLEAVTSMFVNFGRPVFVKLSRSEEAGNVSASGVFNVDADVRLIGMRAYNTEDALIVFWGFFSFETVLPLLTEGSKNFLRSD